MIKLSIATVATVLAVTSSVASAQAVVPAQLDSIIRHTVVDKQLVGLSVGIMQNGKVVLAKGYGLRTLGTADSVTPRTMFAVGSVTKQFTCSALMMLAEEKKLSLADPVSKYFPKLTRAKDITLLDLGGHLSGYRDYYPLDFVDNEMQKPAAADDIITEYATRPLDFEPRSRYSYSNTGFLILGRVIEKVSGQPFGTFVGKRIFTPLNLARTAYDPATMTGDMAKGYTSFGLASPVPADPEGRGWAGTAGAIWSTPSDLLTWDLALVEHKLISEASLHTMTTAQRLTDGRSSGYGCGEGVNDRGQVVVLSHGGAVSGFVAQNTVIPSTRSAVVLLANTDFAAVAALNQLLIAKLIPRVDVPEIHGAAALDAARTFLTALEKGTVDRSTLGADFSAYLTAAKVDAARKALHAMGAITNIRVANTVERGGMEVAVVQFSVGKTSAQALMYRTPDGKVQEFLFSRL
ncbi:MAG TPA: serine hydrolase domain-containing protein [Gemmatimonadaceae bacterium]|nr:serine hydrolase domain-containing protein [Gemmatimonadaceae bacterium]